MIKHVLVPLDVVEKRHPAFQLARANFPSAQRQVLHVTPPQGPATPSGLPETEGRAQLDALGGGDLVVGGDASTTIVQRSAAGRADLIVMGTGGKRGLTRFLLGSVAERVIREAPVPVLTVPTAGMAWEEEAPALQRLLVMMDFSPAAHRALTFVQDSFPAAHRTVLHVVSPTSLLAPAPLSAGGRADAAVALTARNREWVQEARRRLAELGGGDLVEGEAADVALAAAQSGQYDALVLGTSGKSGLDRFLFGSVAQQVVQRSPLPVLTVKAPA